VGAGDAEQWANEAHDGAALPGNVGVLVAAGASVWFNATQDLAALEIHGRAALTSGGDKTLATPSLLIASGGQLDLADNGLVVRGGAIGSGNGSAYTGILGWIQSGRTANRTWDGSGIVTSTADAAGGLTGIGAGEARGMLGLNATQTALWEGHTVDAATAIARYTYAGDANLDGEIDAGDYGRIDNFVQVAGASGYANGDFNYDGFIDAGDYGIIDNNVQAQGAPL
jgi:hypothetical protein